MSFLQCPRRVWLESRGTVSPSISLSGRGILANGHAVHAAARSGYTDAVKIDTTLQLADAALATKAAMDAGATAILEASFVANGIGVRVDVLERTATGWRLVEVKSGGSVKDHYLSDVAIQFACLETAGTVVEDALIAHPSTARALSNPGAEAELIVREDVTELVRYRGLQVVRWARDCADTIAQPDEPRVEVGEQCSEPNPCPFAGYCGRPPKETDPDQIAFLPSKAGAVKEGILQGLTRISELPTAAFAQERNALVREAVMTGATVIRAWASSQLAAMPYPRHYIDFEAAGLAVPRFKGMRPYQAVTFQFSCDTVDAPGAVPKHSEFLDVSGNDPRRPFVLALLEAVGTSGPVFVYSSYEKSRLTELAEAFPDLASAINGLIDRLFDLLPMARRAYYSPAQMGSWSIKAIAPTLPGAADSAYDALDEVADGMAAQGAYIELTDPTVIGPQLDAMRDKLLVYCATDTQQLMLLAQTIETGMQ
jgi:hypothetical protein